MKLYTLHISHRHGDNITVHATREEATAALADYCREYWAQEGIEGEPPSDDDDVLMQYWDSVEDESANIEEQDFSMPSEERATPEEIEAARRDFADDDLEIDDDAAVSRGNDGVWVSAWVYVPNEDGEE